MVPIFESIRFLNAARSLDPTLASRSVIICCSCSLSPDASPSVSLALAMKAVIIEVMSAVSDIMVRGYDESVSSSSLSIYVWKPFETESMRAIPIMPMLPANAVSSVRAFLVIRLLRERCSAVASDMDLLRRPAARPLFFARKEEAASDASAAPAAPAAAAVPGIAACAAVSTSAPGINGLLSLMTCPSESLTILVE